MLDVLIIGGGPIGIACALEAKKNNLNYVVIEKGTLVNSIYHYPENMTFFSTSEKLELDGIPFISKNPKPSKQEALEYYRRVVTSNKLHINLFEGFETCKQLKEHYIVSTTKRNYTTKNVILSTGFYDLPNFLDIPGEDLPKVNHYYKDPHFYALQKVAIVGASNSAIDAALEIWRKGAEVNLIIRGKNIGDRVKYWVKPDIENRIKEGSINAYFETEIKEITPQEIKLQKKDGTYFSIQNDYVLALTGYRPNFSLLESFGINYKYNPNKVPTYDEDSMESNQSGVYLAGVVCGGLETHKWFIENSRIHAKKIIKSISQKTLGIK